MCSAETTDLDSSQNTTDLKKTQVTQPPCNLQLLLPSVISQYFIRDDSCPSKNVAQITPAEQTLWRRHRTIDTFLQTNSDCTVLDAVVISKNLHNTTNLTPTPPPVPRGILLPQSEAPLPCFDIRVELYPVVSRIDYINERPISGPRLRPANRLSKAAATAVAAAEYTIQ